MRYIGRSENAPQPTFEARTVAGSSLAELLSGRAAKLGWEHEVQATNA